MTRAIDFYKKRRDQIEAEKRGLRKLEMEAKMRESAEYEQWILTIQAALRPFEHSGFGVSLHRDDLWIRLNGRRFELVVVWGRRHVALTEKPESWLVRICVGGKDASHSTWQECDDREKFPEWFGNWVAEALEKHK